MLCRPARVAASIAWLGALLAATAFVRADVTSAVLHEYVPADVREDIELGATTLDGNLPAAIDTPSGVVSAPDTSRMPTPTENAYGDASSSRVPQQVYRADNETSRPAVSLYDDPFSPSISPYKRLSAFDAVLADYSLSVADPSLHPVPIGGAVLPGEEAFYGDLTVDLAPGIPTLIPSVGPGARIIKMTVSPHLALEVVRDGAENWFARSSLRARVRIVEETAIAREAFGGLLRNTARAHLRPRSRVPDNVKRSVDRVVLAIGLQPSDGVRDVVAQLVGYFRSFAPSQERPHGHDNIYLDLALSKKGVCRHRAYAFVVTALGLGIPSRMVINEAHAWAEVNDGGSWRRIDLGGAASRIEQTNLDDRPPHQSQPDPFPWPSAPDSGEQRVRETSQESAGGSGRSGGRLSNPTAAYPHAPPVDSNGFSPAQQPISAIPSKLAILSNDPQVLRGAPLRLEGTVSGPNGGCPHARVDVLIVDTRLRREIPVGALATDESGRFSGAVVMPIEVPVGDYDLVVATPGDSNCGAGRTGP